MCSFLDTLTLFWKIEIAGTFKLNDLCIETSLWLVHISATLGKYQIEEKPGVHPDKVDVVATFGQKGEGAALYVPPVTSESVVFNTLN